MSRLTESDKADMSKQKYEMIRVVVCNLYPFVDTVSKPDVTIADAVENIDIGNIFSVKFSHCHLLDLITNSIYFRWCDIVASCCKESRPCNCYL